MRSLFCLLAGAISVSACSSQVDSTYRGDAMLTVQGDVVTTALGTSLDVDAAIAWIPVQYVGSAARPTLIAARVPVSATFPASFTLNALTPPPASAQQPENGSDFAQHSWADPGYQPVGVAVGVLVGLARSAQGPAIVPTDVLGADTHHLVVWYEHDDPTNPDTADFSSIAANAKRLGVPATKGYHLAVTDPAARARIKACYEGGLCVNQVPLTCISSTPFLDGLADYEHHQCLGRSPSASCTVTSGEGDLSCDPVVQLTPEQTAENQRCASLQAALLPGPGDDWSAHLSACDARFPFVPPPPTPIHIELGTSLFAAISG